MRITPPDARWRIQEASTFTLLTIGSMCSIAAVGGTQQNLKLYLSLDRHYPQGGMRTSSRWSWHSASSAGADGWLADRYPKT